MKSKSFIIRIAISSLLSIWVAFAFGEGIFMKEIITTSGCIIKVDDDNYEHLSQFTWTVNIKKGKPSAIQTFCIINDVRCIFKIHRIIMGETNPNILIDHADRDIFNNQRSNLRRCNHSQNLANKSKSTKRVTTSKYKGVYWCRYTNRWRVSVKGKYFGRFDSQEDAAMAYNNAAEIIFGEFANKNIIP